MKPKDMKELEAKIADIVEQFQQETSVDKRILLARQKIKLLMKIRENQLKKK